jgi:hypothetical protein
LAETRRRFALKIYDAIKEIAFLKPAMSRESIECGDHALYSFIVIFDREKSP